MTVPRTRFTAPQRMLHWLMAICILSMLSIGIGMISTVAPKYLTLVQIHKVLGIMILVLALTRLVLRFVYGSPPLPPNLPFLEKLAAESSQYILYALMIGMPLIGWGMLSASSHPVILLGSVHLPPILPVNPTLYSLLRTAHYCFALAFFALILMHFAAMIFHKLVKNDGLFETMAPVLRSVRSADLDLTEVPMSDLDLELRDDEDRLRELESEKSAIEGRSHDGFADATRVIRLASEIAELDDRIGREKQRPQPGEG